MPYKTLLTFIDRDCPISNLVPMTDIVQKISARLDVAVVDTMNLTPVHGFAYPYGRVAYAEEWQAKVRERFEEIEEKADEVRSFLQENSLPGEVENVLSEWAYLENYVVKHANVCDLAILPHNNFSNDKLWEKVLSGLLFKSPVGTLIPAESGDISLKPKRIILAWDSSSPSASAAHKALPFLTNAEEVIVTLFDPVLNESDQGGEPGADIAGWLVHHGCKVEIQQYPTGGLEIAGCIQKRASELGADLVVMGAYGHSKFGERLFGGTTRFMLEQRKIPVLLSH